MSKPKLSASVVYYDITSCTIAINGTRYVYRSYLYSGNELAYEFRIRAKYSPGKAINWIKEHADLIDKYEA